MDPRIAEDLLSHPAPPTAVFAANDEMAAGILKCCRVRNIPVPEYLSIVGYDDFKIATDSWPELTTIHSPVLEIGRIAAQKLLGDEAAQKLQFAPDLIKPAIVIRNSTGPRLPR